MTEDREKQTPRPWKLEFKGEIKPGVKMYWLNKNTSVGCSPQGYADAELIVEAVNAYDSLRTSHAELLEAAKIGLAMADDFAEKTDSDMTQQYWDDKTKMFNAIAKASLLQGEGKGERI